MAVLLMATLAGCNLPGTGGGSGRTPAPVVSDPAAWSRLPPTVFGSNVWRAPGEDRATALARIDAAYGPVGLLRIFGSWPPPTWTDLTAETGARPLVISFRIPPDVVLSGSADARLTAWFRSAPTDRDIYWVYFHEPEDQSEKGWFTPEQFAAAWSHVAELAAAVDNPRLHATMVLMCWTADERSGRDWRSYVPTSGVEVLAWDCYAKGHDAATYADPSSLLDPARSASALAGATWAIAEIGARVAPGADGSDRARWLEEVGRYAEDHHARFVTYFDAPVGGDFRLRDEPSVRAWAALVRRTDGEAP
ncbi:hypothetical protein ACT8ZV_03195 [Nocardioides sp. MAHUQ-72]|uniref:hypothetical protein n=1 Tax=unclassified Nocardioides TaxID=2615069 RepID=UPI003617DB71